MHRTALVSGPAVGLLTFIIGFLAGWRFATVLVASMAAMFATLAVVVLIRCFGRKDEEASE